MAQAAHHNPSLPPQVETYFRATASLANYHLGMVKSGTLYYWGECALLLSLEPLLAPPHGT